ncbi:hypothetical protein C8Q80DRAFT_1272513 [Daedaleopsis nitida]|nr:hypothetical protein C8Q80DRAFT_1272513 [Daedaleopsis nitida]
MSRVPRPFPLVIHNDLLSSYTPSLSRNSSVSSINSKTGLLASNSILPIARSPSAASIYCDHSQHSISSRTIPKKLFVVNPDVPPRSDSLPRVSRQQLPRQAGGSYGAMGSLPPPMTDSPSLQSRFSTSTVGSIQYLDTPPTALSRVQSFIRVPLSRQISTQTTRSTVTAPSRQQQADELTTARVPPRSLLLSRRHFMEPLSRDGTPESVMSAATFTSAPTNLNIGHVAAYTPFQVSQMSRYGNYISPYLSSTASLPPQLQPGSAASPGRSTAPQMVMMGPHAGYSGAPLAPARLHTATSSNASIHSVVPSLHGTDEYGQPLSHSASRVGPHVADAQPIYSRLPSGMRLGPPPHAHTRTGSDDPVWRPYSAGARMTAAAAGLYDDVLLPNPYNRGAEIRRYGSVPHAGSYDSRPGFGYGGYGRDGHGLDYGYGYASAYGLAAGMGMPVGHGQTHERGIARGAAADGNDSRWREIVWKAATTP